jgi:hypothetical protein
LAFFDVFVEWLYPCLIIACFDVGIDPNVATTVILVLIDGVIYLLLLPCNEKVVVLGSVADAMPRTCRLPPKYHQNGTGKNGIVHSVP